MSDRLARRGFFALLASLPTMMLALFGRRHVEPQPVAELAFTPGVGVEGEAPVQEMLLRHTAQMNAAILQNVREREQILCEQAQAMREQQTRMVDEQYRILEIQQSMLDRQHERDLAALVERKEPLIRKS